MVLGLHKVSKFYYYPGFHEPGTVLALGINKRLWDGLSADDRNAISTVANAEYVLSLAEFNANNAKSLEQLREDKAIEIRKFNDSLLEALGKTSGEVVAETGQKDPLMRRIYDSYIGFRRRATNWAERLEIPLWRQGLSFCSGHLIPCRRRYSPAPTR